MKEAMKAFAIISLLTAALYVGAAIFHRWQGGAGPRGKTARHTILPESISAMVYDLPRPWQWVWTVWLMAVTFTVASSLIEAMPDAWRFVAFLTVAALGFVAAMPLVRHGRNTGHYVCAIAAAVLSQVCVLLTAPCWLLLWTAFPAVLAAMYCFPRATACLNGRGVFLLEVLCAATVYAALIYHFSFAV